MAKLITERRIETEITFSLCFDRIGERHSGFGFDCDEQGNVRGLTEGATESHRKLVAGEMSGFQAPYVERFEHSYKVAAVYKCDDCGDHVHCGSFTNTCDCGADYNWNGSRLADREQWGEETGEHISDILRIE